MISATTVHAQNCDMHVTTERRIYFVLPPNLNHHTYMYMQVIMATNRSDTLDPALLRPGRLDRKIEFPMPDRRQKRLIFSTITSKMNLSEEVDLEDCILPFLTTVTPL